jgi:hypothetical protein
MLVSVASLLPIILVGPISDAYGTMPVVLVAAGVIFLVGIVSLVARGHAALADDVPEAVEAGVAAPSEPSATATAGPSPEEP